MALISKNFIDDTQGSAIDVTPVIVIADLVDDEYQILDVFSTSDVDIRNTQNDVIQSKEIISKISGIKNEVDYENKKIKINTFRFSIYNYYDVTKKLTNSESYILKDGSNPTNSFIGKYVILYYKTPKTSIIELKKGILSIDDNYCSIIFTGIVNRITQTDKEISIQAEDFTQQYIQDKQLPVNKVGDLDQVIKDNIIDRDDEQPIPMIFGKVDRCPSITYKTNIRTSSNFKSLAMIHDSNPISGNFFTSKTMDMPPFYIYLEDDDDYVYFPYETDFDKLKAQTNFVTQEEYLENRPYIFPEMEGENESTPIICIGWTFPLTAYSDLSGENSLTSLDNQASDANQTEDDSALWYNFGLEKKWYREPLQGQEKSITLPPINYTEDKLTRWILFKLDKNKKLIRITGSMEHFTELDENGNPNQHSTVTNSSNVGTIFKPFNPDFWVQMFENNFQNSAGEVQNDYIHTDNAVGEQFELVGEADASLNPNDSHNSRIAAIIKHWKEGTNRDLTNVEHTIVKESFDDTIEVDRVLWFEKPFTPSGSRIQGHRFSSLAFNYITEKTDYESDTFYASLKGRKDYASTEDINNLTALQDEANLTPRESSLGTDGVLPDFEALIDEWDSYFDSMYLTFSEQTNITTFLNYALFHDDNYDFGVNEQTLISLGSYAETWWTTEIDLNYKTNSDNDDSSFVNTNQMISIVLHGLMKKLYINIYDNVLYNEMWEESMIIINNTLTPTSGYWYNLLTNRTIDSHPSDYHFPFKLLFQDNFYDVGEYQQWQNLFLNYVGAFSTHRRALIRRVLKYLYQNPLNTDTSTDSVVTGYTYEYDSFDVEDYNTMESISDWINNLTPYLDDTISTINKDILDVGSEVSSTGTNSDAGHRHELYLWDENPNIYGTNPPYITKLWTHIDLDSIRSENFVNLEMDSYQTSGIVEKPTDIFINLLSRELGYGTGDNILDPNFFNTQLLTESREIYDGWKMGFCLDKSVDAKKLLEDISNETQSLFTFTSEGNFGLITIKNKYTYDDINHIVDSNDIINYKITRTKRENVVTSSKMFYRYDNGKDNYPFDTGVLDASTLISGYDGLNYYNFEETNSYKEKELRYHTDTATVMKFQKFDLMNNCNQHLIIEFDVPLSLSNLKLGAVIYIPLINSTKAFGIDYSKVEILNGQAIYPLWITTSINIGLNKLKIKATQLHHLPSYMGDVTHGFYMPDEAPTYIANLNEFNTTYPTLRNYNYLPPEQREEGAIYVQGGLEIPYGDANMDGIINVSDIVEIMSLILSTEYSEVADTDQSNVVNVTDVVAVITAILE